MQSDTIISLILALPIGVITGLYSGLIVSRYIRFSDLRNELLRIIRSIDFVQEEKHIYIFNDQDIVKIPLIASDLFFLQHKKAGEIVCDLRKAIDQTKILAIAGEMDISMYEEAYSQWQKMANKLPPNRLVLFSLWSNL